jgi:prepilin-type N-terminal cleavage/methylation domain-containing protein
MRVSSSKFKVPSCEPRKPDDREQTARPAMGRGAGGALRLGFATAAPRAGFSLVEILVVSALLSLIVFALMSVFSSTQRAFRASVTQTGVLEGGKAAADLITSDLSRATPAYDRFISGNLFSSIASPSSAPNFFVATNAAYYTPLLQTLPGSGAYRTNQLQWFFVLSRQNTEWIGTGYIVNSASSQYFYPLYRYYAVTNTTTDPAVLFSNFVYDVDAGCINMSHVLDGVVHLVIRAYDVNGILIPNGYAGTTNILRNTSYVYPPAGIEASFFMFSNALPASVELQLGVMEDRAVARCQAMNPGQPVFTLNSLTSGPLYLPQWNYMQGLAGRVHVFRERVTIQNVDPTIFQ